MAKFVRVDDESDTRIVDVGRVKWTWYRPWACTRCKSLGAVVVVLPPSSETRDEDPRWRMATSNEELAESMLRSHRDISPLCIAGASQIMAGRVYRIKGGKRIIWLLGKGETEADLAREKWPPWRVDEPWSKGGI